MTITDLSTVLTKQDFFKDFAPGDLQLIAGCAKNVTYPANTLLGEIGGPANSFYLVRKGLIAIETHLSHKGAQVIQVVHPGDVVGWSWIFPPYKWSYDIRTVEDVTLMEFDGACLRTKCDKEPALGYRLMRRFSLLIAERLEHSRIRLLDIYGKNEAKV
jgi:CRP-like cAMP-binding protein